MKRKLFVGLAVGSSVLAMSPAGAMAATAPSPAGLASPAALLTKEAPAKSTETQRLLIVDGRKLERPGEFEISDISHITELKWGPGPGGKGEMWGQEKATAPGVLEVESKGKTLTWEGTLELRGTKKVNGINYYTRFRFVSTTMPPKVRQRFGRWATASIPS